MESTDYASDLLNPRYQQDFFERLGRTMAKASEFGVQIEVNKRAGENLRRDRNLADTIRILNDLIQQTAVRLHIGGDMDVSSKERLWALFYDMLADQKVATDMAIAFVQRGMPLNASIRVADTSRRIQTILA